MSDMIKKTLFFLVLLFSYNPAAITAEQEPAETVKLHVIYSEKLRAIMHKLSLSLYDEELSMEQINEIFDNASELLLAAKRLDQALPGIDLSITEKNIFITVARQLQIEANNLGYMAQNNDKEGMQITYERLKNTCVACHELFRF